MFPGGNHVYSQKSTWAMKNPPFEDVFPIENGIFHCHVSFREVIFGDV